MATDEAALRLDWETAGDERDENGELVPDGRTASVWERETARADAEADLQDQRESRRSVIAQLNTKAQTAATIMGVFTTVFGFGLGTLSTLAPHMVISIVCLCAGMLLSIIAMSILLWMAVAGNKTMWTRRNVDTGRRALRETRFGRYARRNKNCNDMDYVVQKRRRLFVRVAVIAVLAVTVGFGGVLVESLIRLP